MNNGPIVSPMEATMPCIPDHPTPAVATTLPLPRITPRATLRFAVGFTLFLILFACAAIVGFVIGYLAMWGITSITADTLATLDQAKAWGAM